MPPIAIDDEIEVRTTCISHIWLDVVQPHAPNKKERKLKRFVFSSMFEIRNSTTGSDSAKTKIFG